MDLNNAIRFIVNANGYTDANVQLANVTSFQLLRKFYKAAAFKCHPDRSDDIEHANFNMKELNNAWRYIELHKEKVDESFLQSGQIEQQFSADPIESDPLRFENLPAFKSRETLLNEAFNIIYGNAADEWKFDRKCSSYFFEKYQVKLNLYSNSAEIIELHSAMEFRGKVCEKYTISWGVNTDAYSDFCSLSNQGIASLLVACRMSTYENERGRLTDKLGVRKEMLPGHKVFSPFKLFKFKALSLEDLPKNLNKLNIRQLTKLLVNGQYRSLQQDYKYTDDFGSDASNQFGRKMFHNPFTLVQKLVEQRDFWLVHSGNNQMSFGAHSNDGKSLVIEINNRFPAVNLLN
ncbi:hypothetical protein ACE02P_17870 [Shewanella bicestrii]|uniref:hypothetical protein n=1 Tax=Shewanella xiamenensis TaxID=332186 RepID=UPI0021BEC087|nr:hypothetical protein [Shewanella xiamenensis]MCT8873790.1 hypothetical protein [Shewanella xiamenensis]